MRLLIDEMFPPEAAMLLRERHQQDASHVVEQGLGGLPDAVVADAARNAGSALVTENVADFAGERDLVLVCVLKRTLPSGGGMAEGLARLLVTWIDANPDPYVGQHWPTTA